MCANNLNWPSILNMGLLGSCRPNYPVYFASCVQVRKSPAGADHSFQALEAGSGRPQFGLPGARGIEDATMILPWRYPILEPVEKYPPAICRHTTVYS